MTKSIALIAVAGLAASSNAQDILVEYNTAASTDNPTLTADVVDASLGADVLSAGSGINAANGSTYNWNGWADGDPSTPNNSAAEAIAEDEVWNWGFDVTAADTVVTLDSFNIRLDRSGTGPNMFEIFVSVNGGAGTSVLSDDFGDSSGGREYEGVSLGGLMVSTGDSVEFTLAAWGGDSGGTSNFGTFDLESLDFNGPDQHSLRIFGTVVPAPASAALLGLGGMIAARRRRA